MSVAAIIVNYNAGQWLHRSVKSVLADDKVCSLFVVDNCSQDNSLEFLSESLKQENIDQQRLEIIKNEQNLGFGKANNQVLELLVEQADSEFVLLINPDCELKTDVLDAMLPYFELSDELGMAGCVIKNSDGSIQETCRRRFPTPWSAFLRITQLSRFDFIKRISKQAEFDLGSEPMPKSMVEVEAISGAFMLVRLSAIKEVGLFDEAYFMHCEDLDWCMRFSNHGWHVGFVPEVSVIHEKGVSSQARPVGVLWNLHQGMLRFFDKFYQEKYPWALRFVVRIGIYANFTLRATVSLGKQVVQQSSNLLKK